MDPTAESLFEEHLAEHGKAHPDDAGRPEAVAFQQLCALHPELAEELKSVPDPEGLLLLLEKAAKIGECKDRGREAFKSGKHKEALSTYAEASLIVALRKGILGSREQRRMFHAIQLKDVIRLTVVAAGSSAAAGGCGPVQAVIFLFGDDLMRRCQHLSPRTPSITRAH